MKMKTFNKATFLVLALMLLFVQLSLSVVALGKPLGPEIGIPGFDQDFGCGLEICECDDYDELGGIVIIPGLELPDLEQSEEDELHPIEAVSSNNAQTVAQFVSQQKMTLHSTGQYGVLPGNFAIYHSGTTPGGGGGGIIAVPLIYPVLIVDALGPGTSGRYYGTQSFSQTKTFSGWK